MVQPEPVVDELPAESTPVAAGPLVPSFNDISAEIQQARSSQHRYVVYGDTYEVMEQSLGYVEVGVASWYQAPGTSTWYQLTDTRSLVPVAWCQVPGTQYQAPGT